MTWGYFRYTCPRVVKLEMKTAVTHTAAGLSFPEWLNISVRNSVVYI